MSANGEVERRLSSLQNWVIAGLAFMFTCALTFLIIAIVVVVITSNRVEKAKHKSDQGLACYVLPQIDRSIKTLPTISYYIAHPSELESQLDLLRHQRDLALETWGACESLPPEDYTP